MAAMTATMDKDHEGLKIDTIEGVTFYRIDYISSSYDETDTIDPDAADWRKKSGWWGYQDKNSPDRLHLQDLKAVLNDKAKLFNECSSVGLDLPGIYMYINKRNGKKYVGKAVDQTLLQRQHEHLISASHSSGQSGKFDRILSCYKADDWDFTAIPISDPQIIDETERQLVLLYKTYDDRFGYNTQIPGGR